MPTLLKTVFNAKARRAFTAAVDNLDELKRLAALEAEGQKARGGKKAIGWEAYMEEQTAAQSAAGMEMARRKSEAQLKAKAIVYAAKGVVLQRGWATATPDTPHDSP